MSATGTAREESQSMEFSVTKSALLNELNTTQGVVERKTTIPILSNLLVEAHDGRVTITATDLELSVRIACEAACSGEDPCGSSGRTHFQDKIRHLHGRVALYA